MTKRLTFVGLHLGVGNWFDLKYKVFWRLPILIFWGSFYFTILKID